MSIPGPSGTILVVDDQEDLRRLLGLALRRHDFEVLEAPSDEAAMEIRETLPGGDAVLRPAQWLPAGGRRRGDQEKASVLLGLGVDLAQGYLFGRPERLPD